jgi:NADH-quinone oxidoreductase subunit N
VNPDLLGQPEYWTVLRGDAMLLLPEIVLVCGMCAVILAPFITRNSRVVPAMVTIATLVLAFASVIMTLPDTGRSAFAGMVAIDPFSQFFKLILLAFTTLVVAMWLIITKRHTRVLDAPDLFCLVLGAATGMALMSSASNLLMIFIATESASIPSYALAGFRKRTRIGSEGSLKYVIVGAASTAITLYGMSLVFGAAGSLDLAAVGAVAAEGMSPLMAIGLLAMFAGIAFKLSAVPMHFWCPDVFQGAPIEITTFLSVASKGGAMCLLVRVVSAFGLMPAADGGMAGVGLAVAVGTLGAVTATWGNLAALAQSNIKRLLAYSSIGHAGYMIMAAAAAVTGQTEIAAAILFYLLVYMFMNLGAFTVAAIIEEQTGTQEITDYAGMSRRSPVLAVLLSVFLLSLFGMPGLGGFIGKIVLAVAMIELGPGGFALLAVLLLNTLISLYYYVRPIYFMYLAREERERPAFVPPGAGVALLGLCALAVLVTGLSGYAVDLSRDFADLLGVAVDQAAMVTPEVTP